MMVQVTGIKNGEKMGFKHTVLEYYDHETDVSAMARTTAYTASIAANLLANGQVKDQGIIPMEKLGQDHSFVKNLFNELGKRNVEIKETEI
jgi:lysine 6-dehydrogenase